jgi:hypothetical protein
MSIPYKRDDNGFRYLTDRFGTVNDAIELTTDEKEAVTRLVPFLFEETSNVVCKADGTFGILMEVVEIGHDEQDEEANEEFADQIQGMTINGVYCDGTNLPTLNDTITELQAQAATVQDAVPAMELEVATDTEAYMNRAVIRGFLPEGSSHLAEISRVADEMLGVYDRLKASAPVPSMTLHG